MSYLKQKVDLGAENDEDIQNSEAALIAKLEYLQSYIKQLNEGSADYYKIQLDIVENLVELERGVEAWNLARPLVDTFIEQKQWERAAETCNLLFQANHLGSLSALGQGIWLAVTYPVNPELTVALLQHVVDETPDESDGAAVAMTTAAYIVDIRASDSERDNLQFVTQQILATVARRHSEVNNQTEFDAWVEKLELREPQHFLPRLRNVVDVLVQDDWWFDRELLQSQLPD